MKNQKEITIIILLILLILVVGGIVAWKFNSKRKTIVSSPPTVSPITSSNPISPSAPSSTAEEKIYRNEAKNFCEQKEGFVYYSSLLNFDQDKEKEVLVICGDLSHWKTSASNMWEDKHLYVLNKENGEYRVMWEREAKNLSSRPLFTMDRPVIKDIDGDGIDEIFLIGSVWGGTCTGGSNVYFLYSPRYDELFYIEERGEWDSTCTTFKTFVISSPNLRLEQYKIFKNFLKRQVHKE